MDGDQEGSGRKVRHFPVLGLYGGTGVDVHQFLLAQFKQHHTRVLVLWRWCCRHRVSIALLVMDSAFSISLTGYGHMWRWRGSW